MNGSKIYTGKVPIITNIRDIQEEQYIKVGEAIQDEFAEKANHVARIVIRFQTVDEITDYYDGLTFFDTNMQPLGEVLGQLDETKVDALYRFQQELHFINKLNSIEKMHNQKSEFYRQEFKKRYTNPATERDELNITKQVVMWMELEEWELFEKAYDELFTRE